MKMWLGMQLGALLILILGSSLEGKEISFTINDIWMESLPDWTVANGEILTLTCIMDINTTSHIKPQRTVLFYKDNVMFHNVSSTRDTERIFIPHARVHNSGTYKCTVILDKLEKTSEDYVLTVKGVPRPRVMLDKKEVMEGEDVFVTCAVEEERAPIHFIIEKVELDTQIVKEKAEMTSLHDNFVTLDFPIEEYERFVFFRCQASIVSRIPVEISESTRSELLTVKESFSIPTFHVSPPGLITEGDELNIRCAIQVMQGAPDIPELIIQKDLDIVAYGYGDEALYSVTALVEHSGNYTCKVQAGYISKVSSIMVSVTAKEMPVEMTTEMSG